MSLIDLGPGERTLIRRALVVYAQQWMAEKVKHRKAGDAYNADYDQDRIDACDRIADKLRLSGQPSGVPAATLAERDPYEIIRELRLKIGEWASAINVVCTKNSPVLRVVEAMRKHGEDIDSAFRRILKGETK